jgi:hypothetical protein
MEFKGDVNVEELWSYFRGESPRCLVIVGAAFLDETLKRLLGDTKDRSLNDRIDDALAFGLLTSNEHHDLHVIRELRNEFAHNMRNNSFDETRSVKVDSLKTWQYGCTKNPRYRELCPDATKRLMYVIGVIGGRLQKRTKAPGRTGPRPEPDYSKDYSEWPPIVGPGWA